MDYGLEQAALALPGRGPVILVCRCSVGCRVKRMFLSQCLCYKGGGENKPVWAGLGGGEGGLGL